MVLFDEVNATAWKDFFEVYEIQHTLTAENYRRPHRIGSALPRACRFCGKQAPEVTFKKRAHLFPQFLGNRNLLSGFECDGCNEYFGAHEMALANYTAAYRPFAFVHPSKNNKAPKYKQTLKGKDKPLHLEMQRTKPNMVSIQGNAMFEEIIDYNDKTNVFTVKAIREPYVPLHVFKCLLKMGLSMVPHDEIDSFAETLKVIRTIGYDRGLRGHDFCHIYVNYLFGPPIFRGPAGILLRKKTSAADVRCPERVFVLLTMNHAFQIFLPLNKADDWMLPGNLSFKRFPAVLPQGLSFDDFWYGYDLLHFHDTEVVKGEEHLMRFTAEERIRNVSTNS